MKKTVLITIVILIIMFGTIIFLTRQNPMKHFEERIILKEKNNFILETQTIMNSASNYFLRVLDPKIDKTEPVVGEVTIENLIKENYLKEETFISGKINISMLQGKTTYIINISNDKYYFIGNYDDFKLENIKEKN